MSDVAQVVGATLAALAVVAAVVIGGQDSTYFVPPPEAVAESFTREIASRRYDRAMEFVDPSSGITEINARLGGEALHARAGAIDEVQGDPGAITGERASASAVLITERAGRVRYAFRLARRGHTWKIVEWSGG
jgi:hypothetical protein